MTPPEHHARVKSEVPSIENEYGTGTTTDLYAGTLGEHRGPAPMPTPVLIARVSVAPNSAATIPIPAGYNCVVTCVAGNISVSDDIDLEPGGTVAYDQLGDHVEVASEDGGEFLLISGEPINEPIVMGGSFVMNTRQEIRRAFTDYQAGSFGTLSPSR